VTNERQGDKNWNPTWSIFSLNLEKEFINGKDYKLFDFTLQKGDTFKLEFPNEPSTFMIVDSTDFVLLLDQREYKRLMLRSPNAPDKRFVWVEGVGDIDRFVFYRPAAYGTETTDYKLTCYYYNYNIYYRAPNVFNCDLKSASDDEVTDLRLNIFPNPATDYLHLVTDESLDIEIRSIIGQRVKSISIDGEDDIDISLLEKGMYVLVFRNRSSKVVMSKLFVKL
jgi:Secretion system C-terminal sorting domain